MDDKNLEQIVQEIPEAKRILDLSWRNSEKDGIGRKYGELSVKELESFTKAIIRHSEQWQETHPHEKIVMCDCISWARDGRQHILTEHHYRCEHYNPGKDAKEVIKALIDGIEEWASDEDGVHPECWEAYKRAKHTIGEYNFDTTENT